MRLIVTALTFVAFLIWILDLTLGGYLSDRWAIGALAIVFLILGISYGSGRSLIETAFSVGFPLAILFAFLVVRGHGDAASIMQLAAPILLLLLVVIGLFKIVFGGKRKGEKR